MNCRFAKSWKEVCTSNPQFYLKYDGTKDEFDIDKSHPYNYQMQHQMLVTRTQFALLMLYIEKDVVVVYVPRDEALCNEIRIRSQFYFREVLLPQLISGHFYANHSSPSQIAENVNEIELSLNFQTHQNESSGIQVPIVETIRDVISTPIQVPVIPCEQMTQEPTLEHNSNSFYCYCNQYKESEATVVCNNINCIIKIFHKSCIIQKRVRFSPKWQCKNCLSEKKKAKKNENKENAHSKKVSSRNRLPNIQSQTRKPLQSINLM